MTTETNEQTVHDIPLQRPAKLAEAIETVAGAQ